MVIYRKRPRQKVCLTTTPSHDRTASDRPRTEVSRRSARIPAAGIAAKCCHGSGPNASRVCRARCGPRMAAQVAGQGLAGAGLAARAWRNGLATNGALYIRERMRCGRRSRSRPVGADHGGAGDNPVRYGGSKGILPAANFVGRGLLVPGVLGAGSGSDLASLRTRADPDGDDYIINGSKLWTTHAHFANRIFCLVRTSSEGKPQAGISFLLIDLDTPGIRITPIISMGGDHEVNQVFFDDVRVPKVNRVGAEGEGWTCAKYLLQFERGAHVSAPRLKRAIEHLRHIARSEADGEGGCLLEDRAVRRRLATFEADVAALEFTELRLIETLQKGGSPGIESSLIKTEVTELHQAMTELAMDLIGPGATLLDRRRPLPDAPGDCIGPEYWGPATAKYFNFRAASIYGGTNEIQRNLIAAYLLDL